MAQVVGAFAMSHSSFMISNTDRAPADMCARYQRAFARACAEIERLAPNLIVLIGTDHFNTFSLDLFPQHCVGLGETFVGWGDNLPAYTVAGDSRFGERVLTELLTRGIDAAYSWNMKLDHSFFGPLHFVTPRMNIPILPIFQNTLSKPMLTTARAYTFGVALGEALAALRDDRRVVVIGSGGLSHWVGGPEHGRLSEAFDRRFLEHFTRNGAEDRAWLCRLKDDQIEAEAGNGGHELRNWLSARGVLPEGSADVYYYEPLPPFIVGCGVAQISPS